VLIFSNSVVVGFGQGFQPVCGYNYGAKLFKRVKSSFLFCIKLSLPLLLTFAVIVFLFAPYIISIFRADDLDLINIGSAYLRIQAFTLPLLGVVVLTNMMLQSTGNPAKAAFMAISRQGLFLLPFVCIFTKMFGLHGLIISQPLADLCAFLLSIPLGLSEVKKWSVSALQNKNVVSISKDI
jgi:Na+-driven multidrug efflux pump